MNHDVKLRVARLCDAEGILAIYAPYVKETAITFEYEVPGLSEFRARMETTLKNILISLPNRTGSSSVMLIPAPSVGRAA